MSKTAIIIMSDPKSGNEESIGKALNGLVAAHDADQAGNQVKIIFQGTGTRWPSILEKEDHMAHKLYKKVEKNIVGASASCSDLWNAEPSGVDLLKGNPLPNEVGLPSIGQLQSEGFGVVVF